MILLRILNAMKSVVENIYTYSLYSNIPGKFHMDTIFNT